VACNSSSRFRGAAFELMSGSISVPGNRPAAIFFVPGNGNGLQAVQGDRWPSNWTWNWL
jgi:hypothetical protein